MNGTMTPPREADKGLNLDGSFISKGIKGSRTLRIPPVQDYSSPLDTVRSFLKDGNR